MHTNYRDNRYKEEEKKRSKKMIFMEENMQAQTPRKESTMARRFLETSHTSSQKGKNGHSSPTRKQSTNLHRSLSSPCSLNSPLRRKSLSPWTTSLSLSPSFRNDDHHHHGTPKLAYRTRLVGLHQSGRGAPASKCNGHRIQTQYRNSNRLHDT